MIVIILYFYILSLYIAACKKEGRGLGLRRGGVIVACVFANQEKNYFYLNALKDLFLEEEDVRRIHRR